MNWHNITFTLGDPSDDGHGRIKEYHIRCNYSAEEITEAYKKATSILGFDYVENVCSEYEESYIDPDKACILIERGIISSEYLEPEDYYSIKKGSYWVDDCDEYVRIFFEIIKLILPDCEWRVANYNEECLSLLNCAGYGLF